MYFKTFTTYQYNYIHSTERIQIKSLNDPLIEERSESL